MWKLQEITGTHPSKAKEKSSINRIFNIYFNLSRFLKDLVSACKEDAANATAAANSDFKSSIFILYCFLKFIRNIKSMGEQKKTPHICATLLQMPYYPKSGLVAIRDAPFCEIVGRNLNSNLVAYCNLDEELAHLSGDVSKNLMAVLKTDSVHGGRENLNHGSRHFNCFIVCTRHQIDRFL